MPQALLGRDASLPAFAENRMRAMDTGHHEANAVDSALCPTDHETIPPARSRSEEPGVCPTDDEVLAPRKKNTDKHSADYILRSQFAGGIAGCAAKTVIAPLDRVKILFQTSNPQFARYSGSWFGVVAAIRSIYATEGASGLFRGHSATLLRIYPYAAIKFVAYEQVRSAIITNKDQETSARRFASGALAGVTSVFFTYPLEVIRVRLAFETKKDSRSSLREIITRIYNERPPIPKPLVTAPQPVLVKAQIAAVNTVSAAKKIAPLPGLANFYRGFFATLMGMVPYAGMSFLTHDKVGDLFRTPALSNYTTLPRPAHAPLGKPAPLNWWAELISGGVAGLVSQTASYPLEVVRRRMQVGGAVGDGHRLRMGETMKTIMREKGVQGFFVGLSIGYVKVVPMVAVSFYTYERMKTWLNI